MKIGIKSRVRNWLYIDRLEREVIAIDISHSEYKIQQIKTNKLTATALEDLSKHASDAVRVIQQAKDVNDTAKALIKQFNLSADINIHDPSWMVMSVQGKTTMVYFKSLHERDIREISRFMAQFEGTNKMLDIPRGMVF